MAQTISPNPRVRCSPFYEATLAEGVTSFTTYNHMLMPTGYGDPLGEYWRLINGVSMWDVAVERQVEIIGPDAGKLAQALAPRQIGKQPIGMGWYVPLCDHRGVVLNDPILLKLAEDRFWLSIADSDVLLWARAVAGERNLDVRVFEPDVSPLAIQGPKANEVVASLFGDSIRELGFFRFREAELDGIPLMVARSGWSKQGGFEVYLMDSERGTELWDKVKEAGQPWDIGPGNPNPVERIESGLLSWGGDTDDETNPYEINMGRYVDLDCPDDTIGIKALRQIYQQGPKRQQMGLVLDIERETSYFPRKGHVFKNNACAGQVTATAWSPRLNSNIGIGLVSTDVGPGDALHVHLPGGLECGAQAKHLPFF